MTALPKRSGRIGAAAGALVLSGANIIRLAIQLALLPVLARLVGPAEYGLVALAVPFVLLCNVLADGGLGAALARRQSPSPELESTVFWLAGAIGAGLTLAVCLAAWPIGLALRQPRLPLLIVAIAPILVLSGFTAAANARVIREQRFTVFAAGDLISCLTSGAAALWTAAHGWGAWSLAVQQLVLWVFKFIWVVSASRLPIRLCCRPSEAADLLRFGGHSIGATLGDFVARNLDNVIVGGVLGAQALGYYAMAYQIIRVPDLVISGPLYLFIFSGVANAVGRSSGQATDIAMAALRLAVMALAPLFVGLGLLAGPAVAVVLGAKWLGAIDTLAWLSLAGLAFSLNSVVAAVLMGLGRSELQLRMAMISGVGAVAAVAVGVRLGVAAAGAALALTTLAITLAYLATLAKALKVSWTVLANALWPAATAAAAMTFALLTARPVLATLSPALGLVSGVVLGGATYCAAAAILSRRQVLADLVAFRSADQDHASAAAI